MPVPADAPKGEMATRRTGRLRRRTSFLVPLAAMAVLSAGACSGGGTEVGGVEPADRETFIATYVDLRVAALTSPERTLTDEARARVLAEHGVTEEQLLAFVERHGEDLQFMRGVWDEVEARLDAIQPVEASDSAR